MQLARYAMVALGAAILLLSGCQRTTLAAKPHPRRSTRPK